jgi:hypothetical protein
MEIPSAKKKAEIIHAKYKQFIISGLKFILEAEKIKEKEFIIINVKENIKNIPIRTITKLICNSFIFEEEKIILVMIYSKDNIKISARSVGKNKRDIQETLGKIMVEIKGEIRGNQLYTECLIKKEQEQEFIELLKKNLKIETIKINP